MTINSANTKKDANDGLMGKLDYPIGNRTYGQKVHLSGAEVAIPVETGGILYDAFESITVSSTSVGFTAAFREGHTHALVTVEANAVRWRPDGANIAPTASVGHALEPNDTLELSHAWNLENIRFIRRDGVDATLRVSYGNRR